MQKPKPKRAFTGAAKLVVAAWLVMLVLWYLMIKSSPLERHLHGEEKEHLKAESVPVPPLRTMAKCKDTHSECPVWAEVGECVRNPEFMLKSCQKSCGTCVACVKIVSPEAKIIKSLHISDTHSEGKPAFTSTLYSLSLHTSQWQVSLRSDSTKLLRLPQMSVPPYHQDAKGKWSVYKDGEWTAAPLTHVEPMQCEAVIDDELEVPEELLRSNIVPVPGVHYEADYNISNLKPPPDDYSYPENPVFLYPEDIKNAPKIQYYRVSNQPRAYYFPKFLTDQEADDIVEEADKRLQRSSVVPNKGRNSSGVDNVRTSSGCWLDNSHKSVETVRRRILAMTGFGTHQTEKLQVLRYQLGQKYQSHLDYYEAHNANTPEEIDEQWALKWPNNWNRAATFFLYLHTTEEGGETALPRANGGPQPVSMADCTKGIRVRPIKGSAVLFYDMKPNKVQDEFSLHGGCPVVKGEKWGAPQWLHVKVRDKGADGGFW